MSDSVLQVELVAADRLVWSGEAKLVVTRTIEGDIGIMPNHSPVLGLLVEGVVDIQTTSGETWFAAVDTGILSVAANRVSILSEDIEMSHEIDLEKARRLYEMAKERGTTDSEAHHEILRLEAKIRAAEKAK